MSDIACDSNSIKFKDIIDFKKKLYKGIESYSTTSDLNEVLTIFLESLVDNGLCKIIKQNIFGTTEELPKVFNEILTLSNGENPYDIIMSIKFEEWLRWYNHVSEKDEGSKIIYHTYHGTKGLEYENVVMILDDTTGAQKDDLKKYLLKLTDHGESIDNTILDSDENLRNLLYVAITRSYKNLFILNNTSLAIEEIEKIFKIH